MDFIITFPNRDNTELVFELDWAGTKRREGGESWSHSLAFENFPEGTVPAGVSGCNECSCEPVCSWPEFHLHCLLHKSGYCSGPLYSHKCKRRIHVHSSEIY